MRAFTSGCGSAPVVALVAKAILSRVFDGPVTKPVGLRRARAEESSDSENSMALSRTLRLTQCSTAMSPGIFSLGPKSMRPREGLRPNNPQQEAGMRIEPPPSDACATGSMPEATAAAAPPEEPPLEWPRFRGYGRRRAARFRSSR